MLFSDLDAIMEKILKLRRATDLAFDFTCIKTSISAKYAALCSGGGMNHATAGTSD